MNTDGSMKIKPVTTVMGILPMTGDVVPLVAVPHVFEAPADDSSEPEGGIKLEVVSDTFEINGTVPDSSEDKNNKQLMPKEKVVIIESIGEPASAGVEPSEPVLPKEDELATESDTSHEIESTSKPSGPTSDIERIPDLISDTSMEDKLKEDEGLGALQQPVEHEPKTEPDDEQEPKPEPEQQPEPEPEPETTTTTTTTTTEATTTRPGSGSIQVAISCLTIIAVFTVYLL